jgi:hypothetical protein
MGRIAALAAVASLVVPAAAGGTTGAYGVAIRDAIVNPDHTNTMAWSLEGPNVFNAWIAVDGFTVRGASDRATAFRTPPVSAGWHTITIEAHEFFETYTREGSGCRESGSHWVCLRIWRASRSVSVQDAGGRRCSTLRVVGLQLKVAQARIKGARCSLDSVEFVPSGRAAGIVLSQLRKGTALSLIVSERRSG